MKLTKHLHLFIAAFNFGPCPQLTKNLEDSHTEMMPLARTREEGTEGPDGRQGMFEGVDQRAGYLGICLEIPAIVFVNLRDIVDGGVHIGPPRQGLCQGSPQALDQVVARLNELASS